MLGLPVACTAGDDKVELRIGKKSTYASGVRSTITTHFRSSIESKYQDRTIKFKMSFCGSLGRLVIEVYLVRICFLCSGNCFRFPLDSAMVCLLAACFSLFETVKYFRTA